MTKIFFDTEFTGLHQQTTLMSIGLIDEFGDTFYAEFTDYDQSQVNDWLRENVEANFFLTEQPAGALVEHNDDLSLCRDITLRGTREQVKEALINWLSESKVHKGSFQMWSDCLAYDWVLFNALLADYSEGYPQLPAGVHYIPMDICTLFELKGIDPDINREEFSGMQPSVFLGSKHNARHDARVIRECYYKMVVDEPKSISEATEKDLMEVASHLGVAPSNVPAFVLAVDKALKALSSDD